MQKKISTKTILLTLKNFKIDNEILNIIKKCKTTKYYGIYQNIELKLKKKKKLIAFIGPTKSGKTTIIKYLTNYYPKIKTATTRPKREDEGENDYIWLKSKKKSNESLSQYINRVIKEYDLLEVNYFAGNLYGTPRISVESTFKKHNLAIITSENNGAKSLIHLLSDEIDVVIFFVLPDSLDTIKKRIGNRNQIQKRIEIAKQEIQDSLNITHFFVHNTEFPIYTKNENKILQQTLKSILRLIKSIELNQIN